MRQSVTQRHSSADQKRPLNGLLIIDKPGMAPLPAGACLFDATLSQLTPQSAPQSASEAASKADATPYLRSLHPTSHDIVQHVRRLSRTRRIGHTGTLDPMASGVLVLCLGWATRLVEYYQGHDKQYLAEITFGCETDTCDALGAIVAEAPAPRLDAATVEEALAAFRGAIMQTPPIYSALKQGGESLHRKARRGEAVEVAARPITIHSLTLVEITQPNRITLRMHTSAGAYVRSLARDLGKAMASRATLTALRRERAGAFTLADAHSVAQIESVAAHEGLAPLLLPPGAGLDLPTLTIDERATSALGNGQIVALPHAPHADVAQARNAQGDLLGILRPSAHPAIHSTPESATENMTHWKADKWFANYAQEDA